VLGRGRVAVQGTPDEVKRQTGKTDLEEAFVSVAKPGQASEPEKAYA
jgi:hypothetical protein